MTPEAQRIAIAEACGWTEAFPNDKGCLLLPYKWRNRITGVNRMELPDYLSDLDAMHEAEKVLAREQRQFYGRETARVLERSSALWIKETFDFMHVAAAQRAEAFLRTLNLWDDSK